ncbi:protein SCO1 homolog 2, mitochondrial isoform X4 [Amborella trichopoda]|uniref:protein SCO1 homolog 2, mitochondrial isoform X4 n=1 Tax=Amborella trichopoda TaxID=13333 RepID=UPI0009BF86F7|nr:protein SCO1 homolog 2, mitochondrial isoform X4 [Amborella trichopoda]|eukprot:XP_020521330.1 protein SCO1 homolog 2, mitochondrial isoform X4 [Amborella trichopoda]
MMRGEQLQKGGCSRAREMWILDPFSPNIGLQIRVVNLMHQDLTALVSLSHSFPQGAGGAAKTISRPAVGGPFKLVNTNNQIVTDRDFRGNWTLLYFGYTSSPDVDPMEIQKMVRAIDVLEKEHNMKVNLVFITLDPERDSPWHLRAYLKEFDPKIVGLTGPIDAIRQVAHEYRVFFKRVGEDNQDYLVESSHNLYLMDPNMEPVKLFGVEYDAEQLCYDILQGIKSVSGSCAK